MSTAAAGAAAAPALTPLQEALQKAKEVLQEAKTKLKTTKEARDPQDTYTARVAGAKAEVAKAVVDVAEAEAEVAKATRDKVKEERDPQDTYAARVAEAEIRVAEAEIRMAEAKTDVAKAEADVALAKYEAAKAKVNALVAKKITVGAAWAREDELVEAKTDKDRAYMEWEDARTRLQTLTEAATRPVASRTYFVTRKQVRPLHLSFVPPIVVVLCTNSRRDRLNSYSSVANRENTDNV